MPHGTEIALLGHAFIQLPQATHSFAKIFAYFFFIRHNNLPILLIYNNYIKILTFICDLIT